MHPALGRDQAVQFVDDHPLDARDDGLEPEEPTAMAMLSGVVMRMRWFPQHLLAVDCGVAGPQPADFFARSGNSVP